MSLSPADLQSFREWSLEQQLRFLQQALAIEPADDLLELCASLRDTAPLAWLSVRLLMQGWLEAPEQRTRFVAFLLDQEDLTLHRVLTELTARATGNPHQEELLEELLLELQQTLPLGRLVAMCLVDQVMRRRFPEARDALLSDLEASCAEVLASGEVENLSLDSLVQLSAPALLRLRAQAAAHSPALLEAFETRRALLAREALRTLEALPKGLSQAHAEELLAKRVYTEPGHFLVELLQNAEDAGATRWRVTFEKRRIVVWHDGTPFDARDVVGLTSIGQTTKQRQQIGFFGVGFKSVYEVTRRPQVYSDLYRFEIADVSIPRALASRPTDLPAEGTLLILPLSDPDDPVRSPAALYARAAQLDPCVLLTLRHLRELHFELSVPSEKHPEGQERLIRRTPTDSLGRASIDVGDGRQQRYLLEEEECTFDGGEREPDRPDRTRILLGLALDEAGLPTPLPAQAATLYSYLPTTEHTGLRFFIQGHFDVPVDRERVAAEAPWNRWILSRVPGLLARLAGRLGRLAQSGEVDPTLLATRFLDILPLEQELSPGLPIELARALPQALHALPCLPGADGKMHTPAQTLVASRALVSLFQATPLEGVLLDPMSTPGLRPFLDPMLPPRARDVALSLGCLELTTGLFITVLERALREIPDGAPASAHALQLPGFLATGTPAALEPLYATLLEELDRLERAGEATALKGLLERLRALPILLDDEGHLHRTRPFPRLGKKLPPTPARGTLVIRQIYQGHQPFIHTALDQLTVIRPAPGERLPPPPQPKDATTRFLTRLELPVLEVEGLVTDLEKALAGRGRLEKAEDAPFPGDKQRIALALGLLLDAPPTLQQRLARLPVFEAEDGHFYPMAPDPTSLGGVLLVRSNPTDEKLAAYYAGRRPLVYARDTSPGSRLLNRLAAPALRVESLVADVQRKPPLLELGPDGLLELHSLLEDIRDDLSPRVRLQLAALPLWPDQQGTARPLLGERRVYLSELQGIPELFQDVPFLQEQIRAKAHVAQMEGHRVALEQVLDACLPEARPPLILHLTPELAQAVIRLLVTHRHALPGGLAERLRGVRLFPADNDRLSALEELSLTRSVKLRELYGRFPGRRFLSPGGYTQGALKILGLDMLVEKVEISHLLADLRGLGDGLLNRHPATERLPFFQSETQLYELLDFLSASVGELNRAHMSAALELPIYPDRHGRLGRLGELVQSPEQDRVYPADPPVAGLLELFQLRTLSDRASRSLQPLFAAAGVRLADINTLLIQLSRLAPVPVGRVAPEIQQPAALSTLHDYLISKLPQLTRRYGPGTRPLETASSDPSQGKALAPGVPRGPLPGDSGPFPGSTQSQGIDEQAQRTLLDPLLLSRLPIWPTASGAVRAAQSLTEVSLLRPLVEASTPEAMSLLDAQVDPEVEPRLLALRPVLEMRSAFQALLELIQRFAQPERALNRQARFLSSVERVAQVLNTLDTLREREAISDRRPPVLADAQGRLRRQELYTTDPETAFLLEGMPVSGELLHPELTRTLPAASLTLLPKLPWSLIPLALQANAPVDLPLASHPVLFDPERRGRFYAWLLRHEREVLADEAFRDQLARARIFPTTGDRLLSPRELVILPDLPDPGVDWAPAKEVPEGVLRLLTRQLELGAPPLEELIRTHLMPAYAGLVAEGNADKALTILIFLARALEHRSQREVRAALGEGQDSLKLEQEGGGFVHPTWLTLCSPDVDAAARAVWGDRLPRPSSRYPAVLHPFFQILGVRDRPSQPQLREAMEQPPSTSLEVALGLTSLLALELRRPQGPLERLPWNESAWLLDASLTPRRAPELFAPDPELETLVGDYRECPDLYIHPALSAAMPPDLERCLRLRSVDQVALSEVVRHLERRATAQRRVPFRLYQWLEEGLSRGKLEGGELLSLLRDRAWIYTDDGEYHAASEVLGVHALPYFGRHRGYWERGYRECPALCALFRIPGEVSAEGLAAFLQEVGRRVLTEGEEATFRWEPALPRMLPLCYARLGEKGVKIRASLPVILARERLRGEPSLGPLRLLPAQKPNLLRSDTPTLEQLFAGCGPFFVTQTGTAEGATLVDSFLEGLGIRRLRDAWRVEVAADQAPDQTAVRLEEVRALRELLRALLEVLPRVRLQRSQLPTANWCYETRLRGLAGAGAISVRTGLRVRYILENVGEVTRSAVAAYDPAREALLIDEALVEDLPSWLPELATSLLPTVYDGPGEEQVADLLELLLPRLTRDQMNAWLNRRHFPTVQAHHSALDRLRERVGELLDYGLERRLIRRFPPLAGCDFQAWRRAEVLAPLESEARATEGYFENLSRKQQLETAESWAVKAAPLLLKALGVDKASPELTRLLVILLAVPSLGQLTPAMLEALEGSGSTEGLPLSLILERSATEEDSATAAAKLATGPTSPPLSMPGTPEPTTSSDPHAWEDKSLASRMLQRFSGWLGLGSPSGPIGAPRELGVDELGSFEPRTAAHQDLAYLRRRPGLDQVTPDEGVAFSPSPLPSPWAYMVLMPGARFDLQQQAWSAIPLPWKRWLEAGRPTGQRVQVRGRLRPGVSLLPMPLYTKLVSSPVVTEGPANGVELLLEAAVQAEGETYHPAPLVRVKVREGVSVQYELSLLEPPPPTEGGSSLPAELSAPAMRRGALPLPVRRWLEEEERTPRSTWEKALAALTYVQSQYLYDARFRELPAVARARLSLGGAQGHHGITLLHAGGEGRLLGRGMCYELNSLLVELLRQLGMPALGVTGQVWDLGWVDRPDHFYALALLPAPGGVCLFPLDAAAGVVGARVPQVPREAQPQGMSAGSWVGLRMPPGAWAAAQALEKGVLASPERWLAQVREQEARRSAEERNHLETLLKLLGVPLPPGGGSASKGTDTLQALRLEAEKRLGTAERVSVMLRLMRGEYHQVEKLPAEVVELVRLGLVRVQTVPVYQLQVVPSPRAS